MWSLMPQKVSVLLSCRPSVLLTTSAAVGITASAVALYFLRSRSSPDPDIQWAEDVSTAVIIVKDLFIYPIKSVPGVRVKSLTISPSGVSHGVFRDRCMILLSSEDHRMVTLRHEPRLALIVMDIGLDGDLNQVLILSAPDMPDLKIKSKTRVEPEDVVYKITIWSYPTEGVEVHTDYSQWFSRFLGRSIKLVQHMSNFQNRPSEVETDRGKFLDPKIQIQYHDACPVHMVSESSICALNHQLQQEKGEGGREEDTVPFDHRNFRPNILVSGSQAHDEEKWAYVRINGVISRNILLCDRCAIPTIDYDRAVRVDTKIQTLKTFRSPVNEMERKNYDNKSLFGNNLAPKSTGNISTGMAVTVAYKDQQ